MTKIYLASLLTVLVFACSPTNKEFPKSFDVLINNSSVTQNNLLVRISEESLKSKVIDFNPKNFIVQLNGKEIPSQYNVNDTEHDGIVFVLDKLEPLEKIKVTVHYNNEGESDRNYTKYTQAELSHKVGGEWKNREYIGGDFKNVDYLHVPPEHKDHSWFIRYEGPGWESDKVGYRFYLDQRNATDVFGKKVTTPVLQAVGLDGFDSYHEMSDWGMDVMKVGKSLGVGSIGYLVDSVASRVEFTDSVTSHIDENGVVFSSILTKYFGWRVGGDTIDVNSHLSIHKGTRLTHEILNLTKDSDKFCTGLVKDDKANILSSKGDGTSYGYLATYGPQSLNKDNLGIAVLFRSDSFEGFTEDPFSHIVKLKSSNQKLDYYFLAAWEGEPGGITTEDSFKDYLEQISKELANPISIQIVVK